MDAELYNSVLLVDLNTIQDNVRTILDSLPRNTTLIPVLKSDAYGLGLVPVAKALARFSGIDTFAVAQVSEGIRLRQAGFSQNILVFGGGVPQHIPAAVRWDLTLTAGRLELIPVLAREARAAGKQARVHIKLETGLNRVGIRLGRELEALVRELRAAEGWVTVTGTYSHFADAEGEDLLRAAGQQALFEDGLRQLAALGICPGLRHLANSAASEWFPGSCYDAVRIGRRLYMDSQNSPTGRIRETASLRSIVTHVRQLPKGARLGYGRGITLPRDTTVAVIGIGYGDGLSRDVAAGGPALLHGKQVSLLGCCMDQIFLDVTGVSCAPGDSVTLFGYDELGNLLPSQEAARLADDEGCGLTTALGSRVRRMYLPESENTEGEI